MARRSQFQEAIDQMVARVRELDTERAKLLQGIAALESLDMGRARPAPHTRRKTRKVAQRAATKAPRVAHGDKPHSMPDAAMRLLREAGEPLHVKELIHRMIDRYYPGREYESVRATLVGTLNRRVEVPNGGFTKPAPATYGLTEWENGHRG